MGNNILMNSLKLLSLIVISMLVFSNTLWAGRYFDPSEVLVAPTGSGTVYYVDGTKGNDKWNGRYATFDGGDNGPFKTIGKAIDRYGNRMKGGNTIKIKAGIYRERINIGNITGNIDENTRFTIGPFGDGEVIIDASDTQTLKWMRYSKNPNIFVASCSFNIGSHNVPPDAVIMDDDFRKCRPVYNLLGVDDFGKWFYDESSKQIYVYTKGTDPLSHGIIVTKHDPNNTSFGIFAPGINFLTIYGITIEGSNSIGIYTTGSNVRIEQCSVKFSGKGGIITYGEHSELLRNNVWGNVLLNWPRGRTWGTSGGWPMGMAVKGAYSLIQGNISHDNGGEGIGSGGVPGFNILEDNISYDNWSVNIYVGVQSDITVRRNLVYSSGINKNSALDIEKIPHWTSLESIYKRMRPEGIMTSDESTGIDFFSERNYIYNNIMIGCSKGYTNYGKRARSGMKDFVIANNTIILPDAENLGGIWEGIDLPYDGGNNKNTLIINNIVYGIRSNQPLVWVRGGRDEKGITLKNNFYYSVNNKTPFWSGYMIIEKSDFSGWKKKSEYDNQSIFEDPQFKHVSDKLTTGDYHLLTKSQAIGAGAEILSSMIKNDFDHNNRPNIPSIGAYEYVK